MGHGLIKDRGRLLAIFASVLGALVLAAPASATPNATMTTVNTSVDGANGCQNGNPAVNCNQYAGKQFVWLSGGPGNTNFTRDGQYFFVVLKPGGQNSAVNDTVPPVTGDDNLSDEWDPYTNRTFTVQGGKITAYHGTHTFDQDENAGNEWKIRLLPYSDGKPQPNSPYIMQVCYLGNGNLDSAADDQYPVDPSDCKMDMFKMMPDDDTTPPECPSPVFSVAPNGDHIVTQMFRDTGGLEFIDVVDMTNVNFQLFDFFPGTEDWVKLVGTQQYPNQTSRAQILAWDVAGNVAQCDPVITRLRLSRAGARTKTFRRLTRNEDTVTIRNGRPGLSKLRVTVNGRHFTVRLRPGQRTKLRIGKALTRKNNTVRVRGYGKAGANARLMIAN